MRGRLAFIAGDATPVLPCVDVNLFGHNAASTAAAAIDSVLAQSWPHVRLTLIDDGSTDATGQIFTEYAAGHPGIRLRRHSRNLGAVAAFQRGFAEGDSDYVMPKSADDLIAPDFVERVMALLLAHPRCAMAHAAGLSFSGPGELRFVYPAAHRLHAVGEHARLRACTVMAAYTSSPSFWGIYRRAAVEMLTPIACRAGWDHVLLAELALYGEVRHVEEPLYWRRGQGRPLSVLARAATAEAARGLDVQDALSDQLWRMPCITTAFAHMENFTVARVAPALRDALIADAREIFLLRWEDAMRREARLLCDDWDMLCSRAAALDGAAGAMAAGQLARLRLAVQAVVPDEAPKQAVSMRGMASCAM